MVGRSPTGGFHFLCPSLSSCGRARSTSPRSISARRSMFAAWYDGIGGRRIATPVGSGGGPLSLAGLRFDAGGDATSVLARTASGDFQPSASLAACVAAEIRSGAGTILTDPSFPSLADASAGAAGVGGGGTAATAAGPAAADGVGGLAPAAADGGLGLAAPGGAESG